MYEIVESCILSYFTNLRISIYYASAKVLSGKPCFAAIVHYVMFRNAAESAGPAMSIGCAILQVFRRSQVRFKMAAMSIHGKKL